MADHDLIQTRCQLEAENRKLRVGLQEAEQAIRAIRSASIDALVFEGLESQQVFTLQGAETPYRSFVEHMQEGAVSMSVDGKILYCNRRFAEIVDLPLESIVGSNFSDLGTSKEAVVSLLLHADQGTSRGKLSLSRRGKEPVPVSISIQKLVGEGAALCMVVNELTEIVSARLLVDELELRVTDRTAALVAKNLELQGFTYSVSHDMRTPLRAMVGNAQMIVEDEGNNLTETGRGRLQNLSNAAMKMAQLVDDLLQFARIGGATLLVERTDLGELAKKVIDDIVHGQPDCVLEITVASNLWAVCDARFMGMALQNLFDNACKYRKVGSAARVEFSSEEREGHTVFFVRDQGIGFDMKYVGKLFLPFERLHRDVDYKGTGIGLANVKRAIERHGGLVWAEGEPGVGAKFCFTLPDWNSI